jgi:hypothetical protein
MSDRFSEQRINIKFSMKLSLEMKHCAFNMVRKQTTDFVMETSNVPTTQENGHIEITDRTFIHFFDNKGIIHFLFISQGQTVNLEILKWLHEVVHRKRPELWPKAMQCSSSQGAVKQFLAKTRLLKGITYPIPLIWLRMISVFPKIKFALKG